MKNKINKRILAVLLAIITMLAFPTNAMAKENDLPIVENQVESSVESPCIPSTEGLTLIDTIEVSPDGTIDPRVTWHYLIDTAGVSNGNVNIGFSASNTFFTNVTLVMYLEYHDGSTGNVSVQCAANNYTVPVDGNSRVIARNMTIFPGNYTFKITGVRSTMTYVVKLYAELD